MRVVLTALMGLVVAATAMAIDFNGDGVLDGDDIDLLTRATVHGPTSVDGFDLNGDGLVDRDDVTVWLRAAGHVNVGESYRYGDGDLSSTVDPQDFIIWNSNKITVNTDWTSGNYFVDHVVDYFDLAVWERNFTGNYIPPAELPVVGFEQARLFYNPESEQLMLRSQIPIEVISVSGPRLNELDEFPLNPTSYFGGLHEFFTLPTEPSFVGRAEIGEYQDGTGIDELGPAIALSHEIFEIPIQRVLPGDANLDNRVDGKDFVIWNMNKFFDDQDKSWQLADFNGDERVDGQDFIIWNRHKFTSIADPFPRIAAVPEPAAALGYWWGAVLIAGGCRRARSTA